MTIDPLAFWIGILSGAVIWWLLRGRRLWGRMIADWRKAWQEAKLEMETAAPPGSDSPSLAGEPRPKELPAPPRPRRYVPPPPPPPRTMPEEWWQQQLDDPDFDLHDLLSYSVAQQHMPGLRRYLDALAGRGDHQQLHLVGDVLEGAEYEGESGDLAISLLDQVEGLLATLPGADGAEALLRWSMVERRMSRDHDLSSKRPSRRQRVASRLVAHHPPEIVLALLERHEHDPWHAEVRELVAEELLIAHDLSEETPILKRIWRRAATRRDSEPG